MTTISGLVRIAFGLQVISDKFIVGPRQGPLLSQESFAKVSMMEGMVETMQEGGRSKDVDLSLRSAHSGTNGRRMFH